MKTAVRFPKSINDSQSILAWLFPSLLAYSVISLPDAGLQGRVALVVCFFIVLTGWQSFGIIDEKVYNDVLLAVDLSLFASYWLLIFACRRLPDAAGAEDMPVYYISATIFLLYASWNIAALAGRDTRALATASHLRRFAITTIIVSFLFSGIGLLNTYSFTYNSAVYCVFRYSALAIWATILSMWQVGKFIAASRDINAE